MNNRLGISRDDIDILADTLNNISMYMSPALMRNLIRELAANQITSTTRTDFITAMQRAYGEVLATRSSSNTNGNTTESAQRQ